MSSNSQALEPENVNLSAVNTTRTAEETGLELRRVRCFLTESLLKRLLRKLFPDQRKYERVPLPPLVGYLGMVKASKPYELSDISVSGFCMLTDERWTPGTEMPITLERSKLPGSDSADCFTVQATVMRCGPNGVGFSIVLSEEDSLAVLGNPLQVRWIRKSEMETFLLRLKEQPITEGTKIAMPEKEEGVTDAPLTVILQASR